MSLDKNQWFVSSTGNMEVLFSHTHLIVGALAYFKLLIIFLRIFNIFLGFIHYEKKLTKNIRPTDILQIYTSI